MLLGVWIEYLDSDCFRIRHCRLHEQCEHSACLCWFDCQLTHLANAVGGSIRYGNRVLCEAHTDYTTNKRVFAQEHGQVEALSAGGSVSLLDDRWTVYISMDFALFCHRRGAFPPGDGHQFYVSNLLVCIIVSLVL